MACLCHADPPDQVRSGVRRMQLAPVMTASPDLIAACIPNALLASDQLSIRGNVILDRGTLRAVERMVNTMHPAEVALLERLSAVCGLPFDEAELRARYRSFLRDM